MFGSTGKQEDVRKLGLNWQFSAIGPILGIIFLRFVEVRFSAQRTKLEHPSTSPAGKRAGDEGIARYRDVAGLCKAA